MNNVRTLGDINKKSDALTTSGRRLGTAYEQELEEKLYSALNSKAELNDLSGRLAAKFVEKEEGFNRAYAVFGDKTSQLSDVNSKLRSKITSLRSELKAHAELEAERTAEIKSLKSDIKTLKRKATLAQKASSGDKAKIGELEAEVKRLERERTSHDSDANALKDKISELESLAQRCSRQGEEARRELESTKEDLRGTLTAAYSKNYELDAEVGQKDSKITALRAKVNELRGGGH
jgi:chromosome segregation ATPase